MIRIFFILTGLICLSHVVGGQNYFQQFVRYNMDVTLTEDMRYIEVSMDLTYHNNAPVSLDTIYFHLWANAFKSKTSPFGRQRLEMNLTDFYFADEEDLGGYQRLDVFSADGIKQKGYIDASQEIFYIVPSHSLQPGAQLELNFNYTLRIPAFFSRLGKVDNDLFITHWYPRPAVFDQEGWHKFPYLSMGEFYGEFGDYNCIIHLPKGVQIAATGSRLDSTGDGLSATFSAADVIDFAWFTSVDKSLLSRNIIDSHNGNQITVSCLCDDDIKWSHALDEATEFLRFMSEKVGPYPYGQLTLVQGPEADFTSMEYPQIVVISDEEDIATIDYYVAHEVAHIYFYGILANNERRHFWIDEGLATYYEHRYTEMTKGKAHYDAISSGFIARDLEMPLMRTAVIGQHKRCLDQPVNTAINEYAMTNYGLNAYEQSATAFQYLEAYIGRDRFDDIMQKLFAQWKFKHLHPETLRRFFEQHTGKDLSWFFTGWMGSGDEMDYSVEDIKMTRDSIFVEVHNHSALHFPFTMDMWSNDSIIMSQWHEGFSGSETISVARVETDLISIDGKAISLDINRNNNHRKVGGIFPGLEPLALKPFFALDNSRKTEMYLFPLAGYNYNDGLMIGTAIYNSTFPPAKWRYLLAPMYAFDSHSLTGYGHLQYKNCLSTGLFRKWSSGVSVKSFHSDVNESDDYRLRYIRIKPELSLEFRHPVKKRVYSYLQFSPLILRNEFALFSGPGEFNINSDWRFIPSIDFHRSEQSALTTSEINLQLEYQAYKVNDEKNHYLKLNLDYLRTFKWNPYKSVDFRIFGSYFLKNSRRRTNSYNSIFSRGSTALIHQGFNDYTYDYSFLSRGRGDGFVSQQIAMAGGGFKTALGPAYNIGLTNDLALALNLKTDLPVSLPGFLPLKAFMDIGLYTRFPDINQGAEHNYIYSGGIMLSYFKGALEVYVPLLNSRTIKDIYTAENMRLYNRITFSVDMNAVNPWKWMDVHNF